MSYVNEAVWERIARAAFGVVLLYLGWSGTIDGSWGTFLRIFGFLPLATGLSGWCVLYELFGYSTNGTHRHTVAA